jgi:hypothetical protein
MYYESPSAPQGLNLITPILLFSPASYRFSKPFSVERPHCSAGAYAELRGWVTGNGDQWHEVDVQTRSTVNTATTFGASGLNTMLFTVDATCLSIWYDRSNLYDQLGLSQLSCGSTSGSGSGGGRSREGGGSGGGRPDGSATSNMSNISPSRNRGRGNLRRQDEDDEEQNARNPDHLAIRGTSSDNELRLELMTCIGSRDQANRKAVVPGGAVNTVFCLYRSYDKNSYRHVLKKHCAHCPQLVAASFWQSSQEEKLRQLVQSNSQMTVSLMLPTALHSETRNALAETTFEFKNGNDKLVHSPLAETVRSTAPVLEPANKRKHLNRMFRMFRMFRSSRRSVRRSTRIDAEMRAIGNSGDATVVSVDATIAFGFTPDSARSDRSDVSEKLDQIIDKVGEVKVLQEELIEKIDTHASSLRDCIQKKAEDNAPTAYIILSLPITCSSSDSQEHRDSETRSGEMRLVESPKESATFAELIGVRAMDAPRTDVKRTSDDTASELIKILLEVYQNPMELTHLGDKFRDKFYLFLVCELCWEPQPGGYEISKNTELTQKLLPIAKVLALRRSSRTHPLSVPLRALREAHLTPP